MAARACVLPPPPRSIWMELRQFMFVFMNAIYVRIYECRGKRSHARDSDIHGCITHEFLLLLLLLL